MKKTINKGMPKKTLLTFSFICLMISINAQTHMKISYISKNKDTLILPNDNLGKVIASSWLYTSSKEKKPIIVFADEKTIKLKNENTIYKPKRLRKEVN